MIRALLISLALFLSVGLLAVPLTASAQNFEQEACEGANLGASSDCNDSAFIEGFRNITNVLIFIVGSLSVLMVIVGGVRYVVSAGNDQAVQGAKNTILFAIVGVVVSIFAYAIVNFVIVRIGG